MIMLTLKIIIAILFVFSGGLAFKRMFSENLILELLAGLVSSVAFVLMLHEVVDWSWLIGITILVVVMCIVVLYKTVERGNLSSPSVPQQQQQQTNVQSQPAEPKSSAKPPSKSEVSSSVNQLPLNAKGQVDFTAVFSPIMSEREVLETTAEFVERQRQFELYKLQLIDIFNQASLRQVSGVRAGTVSLILDKAHYDADTGIFRVSVQPLPWSQQFVLSLPNFVFEAIFRIGREEVKQLYAEGNEKPWFVTVTKDHQLQSSFLAGMGKTFPLEFKGLVASSVFQDRLKNGGWGPKMVWIPKGSFNMGSDTGESNEKPVHKVTIGYDYAMSQYEVTFDDYDRFCEATGHAKPKDEGWGRGQRPVINVNWNDAKAYTQWLAEQTGKSYRLPSEAEWEYACRAGATTAYSFGDDASQLGTYAWYDKNSGGKTHPVGEKKPNAFGLYDMHGNVWEWCEDLWHSDYKGAPTDGSAWISGGTLDAHPLRGGSWYSNDDGLRCAFRDWGYTAFGDNDRGLRLSRM